MTSVEASEEWCDAVMTCRAEDAWRMTEPAYRRVIVERRMNSEGLDLDDPAVAEAVRTFTVEGRDEWAWQACAEGWRLLCELELPEEWRAYRDGEGQLADWWRAFAREHGLPEEGRCWGWIQSPRKVAPGCELAQLVDATPLVPEGASVDTWGPIRATESVVLAGGVDFYMRRSGQGEWLLAGLNEFPPDWLTSS